MTIEENGIYDNPLNLPPQNLNTCSFTEYDQYLNQPFNISEAEHLHLKDVADTEHLNRENQQLHAGREPV